MNKISRILIICILVAVLAFTFFKLESERKTSEQAAGPGREEFLALDYGKQSEIIRSMAEKDPKAAWEYLKNNFIVNGQVVGNVHEFAHLIGNVSYEKSGFDGIKICDPAFAFGCFHGVTEKILLEQGLSSIKPIEEKCLSAFVSDQSVNSASCIHGIGHGVYTYEKEDRKKALNDCDAVSEQNRSYCYDGVFMENSESSEASNFDPKNPWKFCDGLDERYQMNCARYESLVFLDKSEESNGTLSLAGENCSLGSTSIMRETCSESLGYFVAERTIGNFEEILKSCNEISNSQSKELCMKGGAIESVFQRYPGYNDTADKLCRMLASAQSGECLSRIESLK